MSQDLKVLPVKKLPDKTVDKHRKLDPRLPGADADGKVQPALVVFQAPVRSGKTNLIVSMLYQDNLMRGIYDDILYISPTIESDQTGWAIRKDDDVIKITENLHEIDLILESIVEIQKTKPEDEREHQLIVLDDMLGVLKPTGQSYFATLCSKYRHWKITLWVTTQNFRAVPITCRYNASNYLIFKTNNRKEMDKMEEEFSGNFPFMDIYADATEQRYNFLHLDMNNVRAYHNFNELIYEK